MSKAPLLILALQRTSTSSRYKAMIWILTFCVYCSYHLSRKPITVVKNALHQKCSPTNDSQTNNSCLPSWPPFDNDDTYESYFGALDVAYLVAYACGMFISGHVAERMNLRYFLAAGMTLSGLLTCAFGFGYLWQIHSLAYYIIIQIICGVFQSTGWPGVVSVMGNWFGKGRRGLIMGIWNAHTSVGNIVGGLIGSAFLTTYWSQYGYWSWSFIFPGIIIFSVAVIVFFLLVPHVELMPAQKPSRPISLPWRSFQYIVNELPELKNPEDVGLPPADSNSRQLNSTNRMNGVESSPLIRDLESQGYESVCSTTPVPTPTTESDEDDDASSLLPSSNRSASSEEPLSHDQAQAVSFIGALKVPGVVEYALCLFFAKLVSYTFLYWLPQYIKEVMTGKVDMADPDATAGDMATLVDVGGIFGAIAAGFVSDVSGSSSLTCAVFLILSIPSMVLYRTYGANGFSSATPLLLVTGFLVNGPYSLITTSVSADLGTHPSLSKSAKALATVTAIIDGTGSLGAAAGPGLAAIIEGIYPHPTSSQENYKLNLIFGLLIGSSIMALVLLSRLMYKDIRSLVYRRRTHGAVRR